MKKWVLIVLFNKFINSLIYGVKGIGSLFGLMTRTFIINPIKDVNTFFKELPDLFSTSGKPKDDEDEPSKKKRRKRQNSRKYDDGYTKRTRRLTRKSRINKVKKCRKYKKFRKEMQSL